MSRTSETRMSRTYRQARGSGGGPSLTAFVAITARDASTAREIDDGREAYVRQKHREDRDPFWDSDMDI
jgi:hypothetical protein